MLPLITRDFNRTISDDLKLNVFPYLHHTQEVIPIYDEFKTIIFWKFQIKYE